MPETNVPPVQPAIQFFPPEAAAEPNERWRWCETYFVVRQGEQPRFVFDRHAGYEDVDAVLDQLVGPLRDQLRVEIPFGEDDVLVDSPIGLAVWAGDHLAGAVAEVDDLAGHLTRTRFGRKPLSRRVA